MSCSLIVRRSQWPRGLTRRSADARLLRQGSNPDGLLSVVRVVCCQVLVSATV